MTFPSQSPLSLAPQTSNIWWSDAVRGTTVFQPLWLWLSKANSHWFVSEPKVVPEEQDIRVMPRVGALTQLSLKRILFSASPGNLYVGSQLPKSSLPSLSYIPVTTANGQQGSWPHPPSTATGVEPGRTKCVHIVTCQNAFLFIFRLQ